MKLGPRLRELIKAKGYTLRQLADRVGVGFTYLCKIETDKLDRGHTPSDQLLPALAIQLDGSAEELILLADRVRPSMTKRGHERPDAFIALANMDRRRIDKLFRLASR